MTELLAWIQDAVVVALMTFVTFMSREVQAPFWLLLMVFMAGMLSAGMRGGRAKASRAYQKIKVMFSR